MRSRLQHDLTDAQVEYLSLALFIALFPVTYCMYRHFRSLRQRYPGTPTPAAAAGLGAIKKGVPVPVIAAAGGEGAGGVERKMDDGEGGGGDGNGESVAGRTRSKVETVKTPVRRRKLD